MTVDKLIKELESVKEKIDPILESKNAVIAVFRIESESGGHFVGDGFYYGPDEIHWRYGMTGHSAPASPENFLEAFRHYQHKEMDMEEALRMTINALNENISYLNSPTTS